MGRRLAGAATAAVLGVAVNVATDNMRSVLAWIMVVAAMILTAVAAGFTEGSSGQKARIRGTKNVIRQRGKDAAKEARVRGDDNEVSQSDQ